jgi:hypothetical protein
MYSYSSIQWTETAGSSLSATTTSIAMAEARAKMRRFINSPATKKRTTSHFYREHTKALMDSLSNFSILTEEGKVRDNIQVFFATPERAIAKLKEDRNMILPVISVGLTDIEEDTKRRRYSQQLVTRASWDVDEQRARRVIAGVSKAVNVTYVINVWTKYTEDMNQIIEQISEMFNPDLVLETKFGTQTKGFLTDISDFSEVRPGDKADRVLRKIAMIDFETYLPTKEYLITNTGEIESLGFDWELN